MKTSAENISNSILQSIDIVLQERIKELAFDKTLICTIIDDRDKKNGKYQVTDGSIKFWAYSSVDTYSKDEQVRVSVANGDMTQDKYIIGKYIANNDVKPISFVSPLEKVLDISDNLLKDINSETVFGLAAQSGVPAAAKTEYKEIARIDIEQQYPHLATLQTNKIYDTLYMQADFKTLLNTDYITSGTFGLFIILAIKTADGEYTSHTVVFDNSQMFGNPYNFALYSRQQAKFDITSLGTIAGMRVFFFQGNDFADYKGAVLEPSRINGELIDTLLLKNIVVGFGADLSKYNDNTLKLYSNDSLFYSTETPTLRKDLAFSWYNKTLEDKYIGFSDGIIINKNIPPYDERVYLTTINEINRLNAQRSNNVPCSKEGLTLAWEIKQAKPILEDISQVIIKDLCPILTNLYNQTKIIQNDDLDLASMIAQIDTLANGIYNNTQSMYDEYMAILKRGAYFNPKTDTVISTDTTDSTVPGIITPQQWFTIIDNQFKTVCNFVYSNGVYLGALYKLIMDEPFKYKEFNSIYDRFKPRIEEVYEKINKQYLTVSQLLSDNQSILNLFATATTLNIIPYDEKYDNEATANRYAIYWYRKDEFAAADGLMPAGWKLESTAGLPGEDPERPGYLAKVPQGSEGILPITLDPNKKSETFKIILFYNHERFESNELVFTNTSELKNKENLKYANALSIKHGDKSRAVYQEYGMSNSLMNIAERYKKRMLSVEFALPDGAVDNSQLIGAQIFWYVPNRATMLSYDLQDIEELASVERGFVNDVPVQGIALVPSEHHRDGYTCFYKTICKDMDISAGLTPAIETVLKQDIQFCYRIRDYYVPSFGNNTIYCKVIKDDVIYEAEITFTFASYGTSGTDYTLVITPSGRQAAVTSEQPLLLDVMLFNADNEQIAIEQIGAGPSIKYGVGQIIPQNKDETKPNTLIYAIQLPANSKDYHAGIFEVNLVVPYAKNKNGTATITAYYPIAWAADENYYMEGGSMIVYNSQGTNPSYYKDSYGLFTQEYNSTIDNRNWNVEYYNKDIDLNKLTEQQKQDYQLDFNFLPKMQNNKLIPSNMFIDFGENSTWTPYVQCGSWYQPILIIQNRYGLGMLNNWDGSLLIDEKNGTILSSMMGAGRKTENNTFEGILMGDLSVAENENGANEFNYDNKKGIGLYGFNDGAQSFGFCIDGTGFIGKSGRGRILFDGNRGQISSASYQQTMLVDNSIDNKPTANSDLFKSTAKAGMMIDLDDGFIDMLGVYQELDLETNQPTGNYISETYDQLPESNSNIDRNKESVTPDVNDKDDVFSKNSDIFTNGDPITPGDTSNFNPQQVHISLDSRARDSKPYFRLTDIRGKDLIYAGDKHLFIKSSNYVASPDFYLGDGFAEPNKDEPKPGYGMKIDLYQGLLDAYNLRITSRTFFLDSRKNAEANLVVKDSYTGKNLIYMGVPSTTAGEYPEDIADKWYFQSGNYKETVINEDGTISEIGTGMKIDLGLGLIDAYNFKLTSKNVFIDSTKDAKAVFSVKDNNDKYLVYLGVQSEEQTDLSNIWYFQSSNYISQADSTEEVAAAGMKIDLGTGLIDAYNFKLISSNILINSNPKEEDPYFEIKAKNPDQDNDVLYSIVKVNNKQATLAGWIVDENSIRSGALGKDNSLWICRGGTKASAATGFIGNEFDDLGVEERTKEWCLTIGSDFGINTKGKLFARDVAILGGELRLGGTTTAPTTVIDSQGNLNIADKFKVNNQGYVEALSGQIGENIASGMIFIHGQDYGDTADGAGSVFFVRDDAADANTIMNSIGIMVGNVSTNNFYLGNGGLILRSDGILVEQYRGVRLSGDGLYVDGCRNNSSNSWGHRSWVSGDGLTFYSGSNIFEGWEGTERGFVGISRQTNNKDLLRIGTNSLGIQIESGSHINLDAPTINLSGGDTSIENLVELNGKNAVTWISEIDKLIALINGGMTGSAKIITSVGNTWYSANASGSGTATVDGKTGTCSVSVSYSYLGATSSSKTINVTNGIITSIT